MVTDPTVSPSTALDHDFYRLHVTPSIPLYKRFQKFSRESFYQGQVYVAVKYAIFQSSSALSHAAQSSPVVEESGAPIPAMMCLTTTYDMDRLKWQRHNLDVLAAINTSPGNSRETTERAISILNTIALYGVSLARDEMDSRNERVMRCSSNMKEIREKADGDGELKAVIQSSLKNVTGLIQDRFEEFSLKRQKYKILEAVSDEDLRGQFIYSRH